MTAVLYITVLDFVLYLSLCGLIVGLLILAIRHLVRRRRRRSHPVETIIGLQPDTELNRRATAARRIP